jgi:lactate dehydrogenase-like 2-hydroxyacid dehydrogenase
VPCFERVSVSRKGSPGQSELDNVELFPHIGSATEDTRGQRVILAVRNTRAMVRGRRPANIVNPEVFESPGYLRRVKV